MVDFPKLRLPETRRKKIIEEPTSAVEIVAETIDDIAEGIVGGRPASRILKALTHLSPAAMWKRITGLPAPGEVADALFDKVTEEIERFESRVFPGARKAKELEREILE
jgi:hypothetical protein